MPRSKKKKPSDIHPVDLRVGAALRQRRIFLAFTQTQLADKLGITFQQIQKYEKGTNRISASRLYELSIALKVPISYFYELVDTEGGFDDTLDVHMLPKETLELARDLADADKKLFGVVADLLGLYREITVN